MIVGVVGASGFVGRHVVQALAEHTQVQEIGGLRVPPQVSLDPVDSAFLATVVEQVRGVDCLVNAAGEPDASLRDDSLLMAANAVLPGYLALACRELGIKRFVHVSSAVVQGRLPMLDSSPRYDAFSSYSRSKKAGEEQVMKILPTGSVVYRPPSVHSVDRRVSRLTARLASSPLATVAAPGTQNTPQALAPNVGSAVAHLATTVSTPPPVVHHPSEGLTCTSLMTLLGGRVPRCLPRGAARLAVRAATASGRFIGALSANTRRVEMMWFGQDQAVSWLESDGWQPSLGQDAWATLGAQLRT